jgi:itaconate CoA-transferase
MAETMRPLEGITVVTLEHAIAAPYCTRHLADMGARVIKIERPDSGDFARHYDKRVRGLSSHFVWTNRSKESVTLDIKKPGGDEVLQRLLQKADVLVQNLAPGAAQRLGLTFATLHEHYPTLIVCDISGYGEGGPDSDRKAYDLLIQGEAGFLSVTGNEAEMVKAGCSIADIAAGMYAYSNILAALLQRGRTGKGSHIEISMLEAMTEWMGYPLYYAFEGAEPPARKSATHATICPYGPFPTGDQQQVLLGVQNEREWQGFCEIVLQLPALAGDTRFSSNTLRLAASHSLHDIICQVFASLNSEQIVARLKAANIAHARVNTMAEVWQHPQLVHRQRWVTVDSPAGVLPALLPPGSPSAFAARMDAVPALGQHTNAVLQELGYREADILALRASGTL